MKTVALFEHVQLLALRDSIRNPRRQFLVASLLVAVGAVSAFDVVFVGLSIAIAIVGSSYLTRAMLRDPIKAQCAILPLLVFPMIIYSSDSVSISDGLDGLFQMIPKLLLYLGVFFIVYSIFLHLRRDELCRVIEEFAAAQHGAPEASPPDPTAAPVESLDTINAAGGSTMETRVFANLRESRKFNRVWDVTVGNETARVEYDGRGGGFECVRVNDREPTVSPSVMWYVPRFSFEAAGQNCQLQVAVNALHRLSWVELTVGPTVVYEEGQPPDSPRLAPTLFYGSIGAALALVSTLVVIIWLATR